jgi:hypothetical protein
VINSFGWHDTTLSHGERAAVLSERSELRTAG